MKNYDYVVLIGRFQPFHNSHLILINEALKAANNKVIVILGSAFASKNIRNPFSALEREEMIINCIDPSNHHRVVFVHMRDYYYNNNMWLSEVQNKVFMATNESKSVALMGHESDYSSEYLKQFPQWGLLLVPSFGPTHATDIRKLYFTNKSISQFVPKGCLDFLVKFKKTERYQLLCDEYSFIDKYKSAWATVPYPPTFVTVDSVVIKSGHVLVVKRKSHPGKGLLALPGGFLKTTEETRIGAIRELKEETKINVPKDELNKMIVCDKIFDYPDRSLRGRVITHCFLIDLGNGVLPKIKGSDDAEHAFWMPLNEVNSQESNFFEDHYHIINYFSARQ